MRNGGQAIGTGAASACGSGNGSGIHSDRERNMLRNPVRRIGSDNSATRTQSTVPRNAQTAQASKTGETTRPQANDDPTTATPLSCHRPHRPCRRYHPPPAILKHP